MMNYDFLSDQDDMFTRNVAPQDPRPVAIEETNDPAALALIKAQDDLRDEYLPIEYDDKARWAEYNAKYDALVEQLKALLGPHAACWLVDSRMWGEYSDFYKDRNGIRPRWFHTWDEVKHWLDNMPPYEDDYY